MTAMDCKQNNFVFQWMKGYFILGNYMYGSSIFPKITVAVEDGKEKFPFTLGQNRYDLIDYPDYPDICA